MVQKDISDYYEQMYKLYPNVRKEDIIRILLYGFKSLYLNNNYGCDVLINRKSFWVYFGQLMTNSLNFFKYYVEKIARKTKVLYKRNKIPWDGYYYFALTSDKYQKYLDLIKGRGRKRRWFTFDKIILYRIFDECNIKEYGAVAIFRIPWSYYNGYSFYEPVLKTDKAELLFERKPLKMTDILKSNYNGTNY